MLVLDLREDVGVDLDVDVGVVRVLLRRRGVEVPVEDGVKVVICRHCIYPVSTTQARPVSRFDDILGKVKVFSLRPILERLASFQWFGSPEADPDAGLQLGHQADAQVRQQGVDFGFGADLPVLEVQVELHHLHLEPRTRRFERTHVRQ